MNTQAFLEVIRYTHTKIDDVIAGISTDEMQLPGANGGWSIKQILGHIAWYEKQMVLFITSRNLAGSDWWQLPLDERNKLIADEINSRSATEINQEYHAIFRDLDTAIQTLRDEELNQTSAFANLPEGWIPWQVIASNTFEHYSAHFDEIVRWRKMHSSRSHFV